MTTNRERQVDELILLESMYPTEFTWLTSNQAPDPGAMDLPDPKVNLKIRPGFALDITLPGEYPESAKPTAYLNCGSDVDTGTRKTARKALEDILQSLDVGIECLDLLVQDLAQKLADLVPAVEKTDADAEPEALKTDTTSKAQPSAHRNEPKIKLVLLWSHHLLATSKRKDIIAWSRELSLAGFSRPGYPGAILIEGEEHEADEFVSRIKALRWQALQIRAEASSDRRRITSGAKGDESAWVVKEVESLGDIVDELKGMNEELASWFLEGMKIGHG